MRVDGSHEMEIVNKDVEQSRGVGGAAVPCPTANDGSRRMRGQESFSGTET